MTDGATGIPACPYVGLIPFEPEDAEYFFGRENDTEILRLNAMAAQATLIYGPSGVGKSSVINAGLTPALQGQDDVISVIFREWTANPVPAIKDAVVEAATARLSAFQTVPEESLVSLFERVSNNLSDAIDDPDVLVQRPGRVVIILDQFEEFIINYTFDKTTEQELAQAFRQPHPSVAVLVVIREDWLARLDRFRGVFPTLLDNFVRIQPLSSDGAMRAIHGPLERFAQKHPGKGPSSADDDLAIAVVEQVKRSDVRMENPLTLASQHDAKDAIDTAFLQVVLMRLWEDERRSGSNVLRAQTLRRLGQASQILAGHLSDVFDRLHPEQEKLAVEMFDRLVTPSETKVAQSAEDLAVYLNVDSAQVESILEILSGPDSRVLRSFAPRDRPESKRYELYHDLLAKSVRSWILARRLEVQVRENLKHRKSAEAEAARRILKHLHADSATNSELSQRTDLPKETVAEIGSSLIGAGIVSTVGSDDPKWFFRPGPSFREQAYREPFDSLLSVRQGRQVALILGAAAVVISGCAILAMVLHPLNFFGEGAIGQLTDATIVITLGALSGALLAQTTSWWAKATKGLASSKYHKKLPRVTLLGAGIAIGAVMMMFYFTAYISGNGVWLRGTATLWFTGIAALLGAVYSQMEKEDML